MRQQQFALSSAIDCSSGLALMSNLVPACRFLHLDPARPAPRQIVIDFQTHLIAGTAAARPS
jgi:hypothetical protein